MQAPVEVGFAEDDVATFELNEEIVEVDDFFVLVLSVVAWDAEADGVLVVEPPVIVPLA